jgi:hypothetical protein
MKKRILPTPTRPKIELRLLDNPAELAKLWPALEGWQCEYFWDEYRIRNRGNHQAIDHRDLDTAA